MERDRTSSAPHVLVTIPTANFTQRKILEGILAYAGEKGPWHFHLNTGDIAAQGLRRMRKWGVDGVIALSANSGLLERIRKLHRPTVLINPPSSVRARRGDVVVVRRDNVNLGRMAAEHLLGRGYRSFAFIGAPRSSDWSDTRREGFEQTVAKAGFPCRIYPPPGPEECADFSLEAPRLGRWLAALPSRTALYTVKDIRGQQILATCLDMGIAVPGNIAVLSTDNDAVLCETTTPSLSSVALDGENTGNLCAGILDDLMHGRRRHPLVDIAFPRIVTRHSTDAFAIDDPILARVMSNIRKDLSMPLKLCNIARQMGVSVRTIEMKALKHFGHTMRDEIRHIRLSEGVSLLTNTQLTIVDIAERCGFCSLSHFSNSMKAAFGYPPSMFRVQSRSRRAETSTRRDSGTAS